MFFVISSLIGGIGLFLLGMILMTDGLKALAGNTLRHWLERFTDENQTFSIASVNAEGKPIQRKGIDRKWPN